MAFERIRVPTHTHRRITVGTDEIYERKLIDLTREGASVTIEATGTGWHIRNIGIRGTQSISEPLFRLADTHGRTSSLKYISMSRGDTAPDRTPGIQVGYQHTGEIEIENCYIKGWSGGGAVSSAPATVGDGGGTVTYRDCYVSDCGKANLETGDDLLDGVVTRNTEVDARGVWALGDTNCINCHFNTGGGQYAIHAGMPGRQVSVEVDESQYDDGYDTGLNEQGGSTITLFGTGTTPDPYLPDGVPSSAIRAALSPAYDLVISGSQALDAEAQAELEADAQATTSTETVSSSTQVSQTVTGLSPNTTYEYQLIVTSGDQEETGSPQTFTTLAEGERPYPLDYSISDVYLSSISGPAIYLQSGATNGDVVVDNAQIDGADVGIVADGVTVTVRNSDIVADTPLETRNGGSFNEESVNTGSDASPSPPGSVPQTAEEAAGMESAPESSEGGAGDGSGEEGEGGEGEEGENGDDESNPGDGGGTLV